MVASINGWWERTVSDTFTIGAGPFSKHARVVPPFGITIIAVRISDVACTLHTVQFLVTR